MWTTNFSSDVPEPGLGLPIKGRGGGEAGGRSSNGFGWEEQNASIATSESIDSPGIWRLERNKKTKKVRSATKLRGNLLDDCRTGSEKTFAQHEMI